MSLWTNKDIIIGTSVDSLMKNNCKSEEYFVVKM